MSSKKSFDQIGSLDPDFLLSRECLDHGSESVEDAKKTFVSAPLKNLDEIPNSELTEGEKAEVERIYRSYFG